MKSKVERIWEDVNKYSETTIYDNVRERLQKTLMRYLEDIDNSSERLLGKKTHVVYKEINR